MKTDLRSLQLKEQSLRREKTIIKRQLRPRVSVDGDGGQEWQMRQIWRGRVTMQRKREPEGQRERVREKVVGWGQRRTCEFINIHKRLPVGFYINTVQLGVQQLLNEQIEKWDCMSNVEVHAEKQWAAAGITGFAFAFWVTSKKIPH